MKIYASREPSVFDFIGKDLWIECLGFGGYEYVQFLKKNDDGSIEVRSISSYLIADQYPSELWNYFPRWPSEPIDLSRLLNNTFDVDPDEYEIYTPLEAMSTAGIMDILELVKAMLEEGHFHAEEED